MKKIFFMLILLNYSFIFSTVEPVLRFVENKVRDGRKITFKKVLQLAEERNVKIIVETGTTRGGEHAFDGDGGFSIFLGMWCKLNDAMLYSVDIESLAVENAKAILDQYGKHVSVSLGDSVEFLKNFPQKIDLLYLDSMDCDRDNPLPSQLHHLHEIQAAYNKLHENSIILIDDCHPQKYPKGGKDKLVTPYLIERGWKEIYRGDQVLFIKN